MPQIRHSTLGHSRSPIAGPSVAGVRGGGGSALDPSRLATATELAMDWKKHRARLMPEFRMAMADHAQRNAMPESDELRALRIEHEGKRQAQQDRIDYEHQKYIMKHPEVATTPRGRRTAQPTPRVQAEQQGRVMVRVLEGDEQLSLIPLNVQAAPMIDRGPQDHVPTAPTKNFGPDTSGLFDEQLDRYQVNDGKGVKAPRGGAGPTDYDQASSGDLSADESDRRATSPHQASRESSAERIGRLEFELHQARHALAMSSLVRRMSMLTLNEQQLGALHAALDEAEYSETVSEPGDSLERDLCVSAANDIIETDSIPDDLDLDGYLEAEASLKEVTA